MPVTRGGLCQAQAPLTRRAAPIYDEWVAAVRSSAVVAVDDSSLSPGFLPCAHY